MKAKQPTVFGGNERVSYKAIIEVQRQETLARVKGEAVVLLVKETTSLDFTGHPATVGLGPLENVQCQGLLAQA